MGEVLELLEAVLGSSLLPWQRHAAEIALEVHPETGRWAHQLVALVLSRQNGKSELLARRILAGLLILGDELILHTAQDRAQPRTIFERIAQLIEDEPELRALRKRVRFANGQEMIEMADGSQYRILAPTGQAFRGYSRCGLLVIDELREHRDAEAISAARYTQRAHPNPQLWVASNAGTDDSGPLNEIRDRGREAAAQPELDETIAYLEWSAEPSAELDDLDAWEQANPSLGTFLRGGTLLEELRSDEPQRFATEALCIWVPTASVQAISWAAWQACLEPNLPPLEPGAPLWLSFDIDPERRSASVVGLAWADERLVVQLLASWRAEGSEEVTEAQVADTIDQLASTWAPRSIAYDPYTGTGVVTRLEDRALPFEKVTGSSFVVACGQLEDAVGTGTLAHPGQPELDQALASAGRRTVADGAWSMSRLRSGGRPIDAAMALARGCFAAARPGGADIIIL